MSEEGKLVNVNVNFGNLGDFSKTATALVNRVAEALGDFSRPYHIKKLARAETEAALVRAKGKAKISALEERGLRRLVYEEGKRQENIEAITSKAIPHLKEGAKPEQIEIDWLSNFFDKSRLISDQEMQELWAKMLAQEGNSPQSVSKRTIALLATLDKKDAELFTTFCSFVWNIEEPTALFFPPDSPVFSVDGIGFDELFHLDNIGLIDYSPTTGFAKFELPRVLSITYFGRELIVELSQDNNEINTGQVLLTEIGKQLCGVCGSIASDNHFMSVVSEFSDRGYAPRSPLG